MKKTQAMLIVKNIRVNMTKLRMKVLFKIISKTIQNSTYLLLSLL